MRDILFRGKRTDNGEWVEGFVIQNPRRYKTYIGDTFEIAEVDSETVGQYTGLTDKNGKMIWEGDIVKGDGNLDSPFQGPIIWRNEAWCLFDDRIGAIRTALVDGFEVIGNIHDQRLEDFDGKNAETDKV